MDMTSNRQVMRQWGIGTFVGGLVGTKITMAADLVMLRFASEPLVGGAHIGLILAMLAGGLVSMYGANQILLASPNRPVALGVLAGMVTLWVVLIVSFALTFERMRTFY